MKYKVIIFIVLILTLFIAQASSSVSSRRFYLSNTDEAIDSNIAVATGKYELGVCWADDRNLRFAFVDENSDVILYVDKLFTADDTIKGLKMIYVDGKYLIVFQAYNNENMVNQTYLATVEAATGNLFFGPVAVKELLQEKPSDFTSLSPDIAYGNGVLAISYVSYTDVMVALVAPFQTKEYVIASGQKDLINAQIDFNGKRFGVAWLKGNDSGHTFKHRRIHPNGKMKKDKSITDLKGRIFGWDFCSGYKKEWGLLVSTDAYTKQQLDLHFFKLAKNGKKIKAPLRCTYNPQDSRTPSLIWDNEMKQYQFTYQLNWEDKGQLKYSIGMGGFLASSRLTHLGSVNDDDLNFSPVIARMKDYLFMFYRKVVDVDGFPTSQIYVSTFFMYN